MRLLLVLWSSPVWLYIFKTHKCFLLFNSAQFNFTATAAWKGYQEDKDGPWSNPLSKNNVLTLILKVASLKSKLGAGVLKVKALTPILLLISLNLKMRRSRLLCILPQFVVQLQCHHQAKNILRFGLTCKIRSTFLVWPKSLTKQTL